MNAKFLAKQSLAAAMTAAYLAVVFFVLLGSSLTLYWMLSKNLNEVQTQLLDEKIDFFCQDQTLEPAGYADLFRQLSSSGVGKERQQYWIRFLDGSGRTLDETPGMIDLLPAELFKGGTEYGDGRTTRLITLGFGRVYRVSSAQVKTSQGPRGIEIALDCRRDEDLLAEYRGKLGLVTLATLLILSWSGILVVRWGLRPLSGLGSLISAQKSDRLNVPIDPEQWPMEIRQVIDGYNEHSKLIHESFRRLSQFSADLAHELRTPLHNLRLQSEIALARPRKSAFYRKALKNAEEEYERLGRLAEGLLFLARAENGKQEVVPSEFSVPEELRLVARRHKARATAKGLRLTVAGKGSLRADRPLFQLALDNLVSNAISYTEKGGKIAMNAARTPDGSLAVRVKDDGIGIDAEHQPWLFDRFFRA
ncbi:MAG TPA: histidine kinase dimerization/phospho-acceptor domain-containing protein, partial [bacterium]|nr:histidine kinase dimerization/phospho-acceptor domain-containing protein [bacterium]